MVQYYIPIAILLAIAQLSALTSGSPVINSYDSGQFKTAKSCPSCEGKKYDVNGMIVRQALDGFLSNNQADNGRKFNGILDSVLTLVMRSDKEPVVKDTIHSFLHFFDEKSD
ncbi:hypothetical protein HDE_00217 [Halotydeus destructor]|nr:hypothetical protein HDE_00217 [Halotydeus destructor]